MGSIDSIMKNIITKYIYKRLIIFIKISLIYLYCRNLYQICFGDGDGVEGRE